MGLFLVLCTVAVAILLIPDTFVGLGSGVINNPEWGIPFLAVVFLITVWLFRR